MAKRTGGGLVTTASDLARWVHLLFAGEAIPTPCTSPTNGFSIAVQVNCDHPEMAETRRVLAAIGELLAAAEL